MAAKKNSTRSKSSRRWLKEHFNDPYVKQSQQEGYRSRAVYKLKEIHEKDRLFSPGISVLDLGAAPGGWSQLAVELMQGRGRVVASDILPMDPIAGVTFVQGDFRDKDVAEAILKAVEGDRIDLVISDMAPNMSGNAAIDQPRTMYLMELALEMACAVLKPGGDFLVKGFQGEGYDAYRRAVQQRFERLITRKPKASRPRSSEVYLLARGFLG